MISRSEFSSSTKNKLSQFSWDKYDLKDINIMIVKKIHEEACCDYFIKIIKYQHDILIIIMKGIFKRLLHEYETKIYVENAVLDWLHESNMTTLISEYKLISFDKSQHENIIDLGITIGGDGTILWYSQCFQNRMAPPLIAFSGVLFYFFLN